MVNYEYKDDVEQLDEIHNPDNVELTFGENLPDGVYQVSLSSIRITRSKASNRLQTVMEFMVETGEERGAYIRKYCGMETAENLDYLTRDLRVLGIKQFKWSNVVEKFIGIIDKYYEIELKTKNGYQNVYIQREIEPIKGSIKDSADEDVPF